MMLKIGEFARLCHVNARTLRFYDEEGVLPADHVDTFTGYRYYHPDKLEMFRQIRLYRDIGFSLDEIKILLGEDSEQQTDIMFQKRRELCIELQTLQGKLSQLERISHQRADRDERALHMLPDPAFENDPAALGRWELCGQLDAPSDAEPPPPEVSLLPADEHHFVFSQLVLLPEGRPWWVLSWTKGTLYFIYPLYHSAIPAAYTLWERPTGRYMTLHFIPYADKMPSEAVWLLYRQTAHGVLDDREARTCADDTDLPILPDTLVQGAWESVDFVNHPAEFLPDNSQTKRTDLWILDIAFRPDNQCVRRFSSKKGVIDQILTYTRTETGDHRGAVLHVGAYVAEAYDIRCIDGVEYLFLEHKSGDYVFGGIPPAWYVFRRMP